MSGVMIGIDPHKGSHTAFALDASETKLGQVRVPAAVGQVDGLLQWAARWPERSWAVEGATRAGASARAAADRRRRAGLGRATQARRAGAAAQHRPGEQERPERRPLGRYRCAALTRCAHRTAEDQSRGDQDLGPPTPRPEPRTQPDRLPVARCALRARARRVRQGNHCSTSRLRLWRHHCRSAPATPLDSSSPTNCSTSCAASTSSAAPPRTGSPASSPRPRPASPTSTASARSSPRPCSAMSATSTASPTGTGSPPTTAPHPSTCPRATTTCSGSPGAGTGRLNHAIYMAALSQIRYPHTIGRAYYDRKIAQGMKPKAALRALKRKISDAHLRPPHQRRPTSNGSGPGRAIGERLCLQRGRLTPRNNRLFGQATPGSPRSLRPTARLVSSRSRNDLHAPLDTKEASIASTPSVMVARSDQSVGVRLGNPYRQGSDPDRT